MRVGRVIPCVAIAKAIIGMKYFCATLVIVSLLVGSGRCISQGFVNLNFEEATVSTVPGYSFYVYASNAIPGWTASLDSTPQSIIGYDTVSLGGAAVFLEDSSSSVAPLQGEYSILFQGAEGNPNQNGGDPLTASISQTAQIPSTTQSLTFWGNLSGAGVEVTIDGQIIPYTAIGNGANCIIYGADVSEFAGLTETLSFVTPANSETLLDNIQFSTSPLPEPSAFALWALGGLSLALRWRKKLSA